ncbi:MAG: hypothetical protein SPF04_05470 [Bacilli bacterium]|nr:hypothetical protein [Bacilli bacterium]
MKDKFLKKIRNELDYSNSFFDGEINIVIDIISKNIDKYVKENKTYKTKLDLFFENIKKQIKLKMSDSK